MVKLLAKQKTTWHNGVPSWFTFNGVPGSKAEFDAAQAKFHEGFNSVKFRFIQIEGMKGYQHLSQDYRTCMIQITELRRAVAQKATNVIQLSAGNVLRTAAQQLYAG